MKKIYEIHDANTPKVLCKVGFSFIIFGLIFTGAFLLVNYLLEYQPTNDLEAHIRSLTPVLSCACFIGIILILLGKAFSRTYFLDDFKKELLEKKGSLFNSKTTTIAKYNEILYVAISYYLEKSKHGTQKKPGLKIIFQPNKNNKSLIVINFDLTFFSIILDKINPYGKNLADIICCEFIEGKKNKKVIASFKSDGLPGYSYIEAEFKK